MSERPAGAPGRKLGSRRSELTGRHGSFLPLDPAHCKSSETENHKTRHANEFRSTC